MGHKLRMSRDVCGATLMTMESSGPELFISIIGVFITKSDIGLATIEGSMTFDILFTVAICGLFSKSTLRLSSWPYLRDNFANLLSVTALTVVTNDKNVYWYETAAFVVLYLSYLIVMYYNKSLEGIFEGIASRMQKFIDVEREITESEKKKLIQTEENREELSSSSNGVQEIQVIYHEIRKCQLFKRLCLGFYGRLHYHSRCCIT